MWLPCRIFSFFGSEVLKKTAKCWETLVRRVCVPNSPSGFWFPVSICRRICSKQHRFAEGVAMGFLITVLTFLVVVVLFLGIWVFAGGEGAQEQVRKRMSAVHKAERRGETNLGLTLVRDE